jgi:ELWxxDGT repeat protein
MKRIILLALIFKTSFLLSQVSEIYSFTSLNKPQDYTIVTSDNLFDNKYYYLTNDANKKTYLYYIENENQPVLVKEVTSATAANNTATIAANITEFKVSANLLYFTTRTFVSGANFEYELWRTDGTAGGTFKLLNYIGGSTGAIRFNSFHTNTTNTLSDNSLNDGLLFTTNQSTNFGAVWKTDGTVAGTVVLCDNVGTNGNFLQNRVFNEVNDNFIFAKYNTTTFRFELFKTDGTTYSNLTDATNVIQNLGYFLGKLNSKIYYTNAIGGAFYSTDGVLATKEFDTNETISTCFFHNNTEFYYLSQQVATENLKLYYVAGDISNRVLIANLTGNYVFEHANDNGVILKKSENFGTVLKQFFVSKTGTITENTNPLKVNKFHNYDGNTYAGAELYTDPLLIGNEIWKYNVPASEMVQDIYPGSFGGLANSSKPKYFFIQNNNLYFVADVSTTRKLFSIKKDFTFTGSTNNLWNVPSNWQTNIVPGITNKVTIPTGFNVDVNANAFANNIVTNSPINLSSGYLNVSGNLNLGAKITLNNNNLNLTGATSTISNASNSNYIVINGTGSLNIESIGIGGRTGSVNFPIGIAGNYNPASIINAGTSDVFSARVINGAYNTYSAEIPVGTAYNNRAVNSTWFINEGNAGGSDVTVMLQWDESQELSLFNRSQSYLGHYTAGSWNFGTTGAATGANPYTFSRSGITSFSPFAILNNNITLPLRFLSFTAQKCNTNQVCLTWKTANEQNVSHFEIERSVDGISFVKVGTKAANNLSQNTYTSTDDIAAFQNSKKIYYRIKEVDVDGRSKQSNINLVQLDSKGVLVYPTLISSSFIVQNNSSSTLQFQLTGVDGRVVLQQTISQGTNTVSSEKLSGGVYLYRIVDTDKNIKISGKVIKQ